MNLRWFNAREAIEAGTVLADRVASGAQPAPAMRAEILRQASRVANALRLNFYKRAKFANSFRWRLLENGIEPDIAHDVTQTLVLHLSLNQSAAASDRRYSGKASKPARRSGAEAHNNSGTKLCALGRYREAEGRFRQATAANPDYPEAHNNLGAVLRWTGQIAAAEISLRRALKLRPDYLDARSNLGFTLVLLGNLREADACFKRVLQAASQHVNAVFGLGQIAVLEGRFEAAQALFVRALELNPDMPNAWAALAGTRKMTSADGAWLARAEEIVASGIEPSDEIDMRFAIGKYSDDVGDFVRAFRNYSRANALQKAIAEDYDRRAREDFVDDMTRAYSPNVAAGAAAGASSSRKPVFVLGMMRSGTSLVEQIIASHPAARGAGELRFWGDALHELEAAVRRGPLEEPATARLAQGYLRVLAQHSTSALHVVDKAPVNCDYLGVIYSVFPNARMIYLRRNPIDTCLSCYFQQFSPSLNFAMDLSDLAHYYRQHLRLMRHWTAALPAGTILEVPYEELIADQEGWTRRILDFVGLDWDDRCLRFHETERPVVTASCWQVRQKIYTNSVARWRNYEKFIGPLLDLGNLIR